MKCYERILRETDWRLALKSRWSSLYEVSTLSGSVGCALMASKFPGILIGEINPTLSRPVLTSSKIDPATFRQSQDWCWNIENAATIHRGTFKIG